MDSKAKRDKYSLVYKQVEALVEGEDDCIANMSNIAALLHGTFGFWWTGFSRRSSPEPGRPGKDPKIVEQALTLYDFRAFSAD